jgi:hypothetical protein
MAGMSSYLFKCDLCGVLTDAPTYGDFKCQHCGQVYVYDECHRIELSEPQLMTLRDARWIPVTERLPEEDRLVLVFDPELGGHGLATYTKSDGWLGDDDVLYEPSHWMPLPPGPSEAAR